MSSRLFIALLSAAAIAFACGPRSRPSEASAARRARHAGDTPLSTSLAVDRSARGVAFALNVTNDADKHVELRFPSGQAYDFVVLDSLDRRVWQWSDGHLFTQSLQNRLVGAGQTVSFEERWRPTLAHGHYTVVATLKSVNFPVEKRVEFALP